MNATQYRHCATFRRLTIGWRFLWRMILGSNEEIVRLIQQVLLCNILNVWEDHSFVPSVRHLGYPHLIIEWLSWMLEVIRWSRNRLVILWLDTESLLLRPETYWVEVDAHSVRRCHDFFICAWNVGIVEHRYAKLICANQEGVRVALVIRWRAKVGAASVLINLWEALDTLRYERRLRLFFI